MASAALGCVAVAALLAGCDTRSPGSAGSAPQAREATVVIEDHRLTPKEIAIPRGGSVHWENRDDTRHRLVATVPNVLDTGEIGKAQSFTQTFDRPGTYRYYCKIHNYMKGTVDVR
ncbi:cupredoxin domain-containing protein [Rhabdothermincola sediminis]|uniref:cupredoxin domain-containing protein n=1 Tax=Rhabdothermincola sediminis TaxID=2751370 RepID=UPI001AA03988|nr:cupredoxin domain-containing protein [Rhabdothermincola sediminis]